MWGINLLSRNSLFWLIVSWIVLLSGCATRGSGYYYPGEAKSAGPVPVSPGIYPKARGDSGEGTPRSSEAIHRATLRPYTVLGVMYYPFIAEPGARYDGIASWYGPDFHGRLTSNGETYDMHAMTAAHKTLPMNTIVRVTNMLNGRQTVVRINDRGPFVPGRIVDLSFSAGKALGLDRTGTAPVSLEVLSYDPIITARLALPKTPETVAEAETNASAPVELAEGTSASLKAADANVTRINTASETASQIPPAASVQSLRYVIQFGSFGSLEGARRLRDSLELDREVQIVLGGETTPVYRVQLTGFESATAAEAYCREHNLTNVYVTTES